MAGGNAEAAYARDPDLAREASGGKINRVIRALQLETEIRTDLNRRADRPRLMIALVQWI